KGSQRSLAPPHAVVHQPALDEQARSHGCEFNAKLLASRCREAPFERSPDITHETRLQNISRIAVNPGVQFLKNAQEISRMTLGDMVPFTAFQELHLGVDPGDVEQAVLECSGTMLGGQKR